MRLKLAIAALCGLVFTLPAFAADLAKPEPAKVAAEPELALPFQGLSIAVILGHAAGSIRDADGFQIPREGYTGGLGIGYDRRLSSVPGLVVGAVVVGVLADISLTEISGTQSAGAFAVHSSSKVLGTVRARAGLALGHTLLYGTGGLATTNGKVTFDGGGSADNNHVKGFVYGAGLESALFGNLGLRIEALRFDWRGAGFASDGFDAGKLRAHDTHIRAALVVKLN